jgi:phospholipid/cholesterol/gamma-HCH transport system ATP-binding protein
MTPSPLDTTENVITIKGLKKAFGELVILRDINLNLMKGENLVVLGRSGQGKSVLIKCIVGLLSADEGSINVLGKEVTRLNTQELDKLRLKVGFNFQHSALYDSMTVRENLEFPLIRNKMGKSRKELNIMVEKSLEDVGMLQAIDQMPSELSGGMRKRVGVARTLILQPEIMLYDEPTAGLDPITAQEINELILEVQERFQTSSIIITHDITCAKVTGNRVKILIDGLFQEEGTFEEVSKSVDPRIKPFFDYNAL